MLAHWMPEPGDGKSQKVQFRVIYYYYFRGELVIILTALAISPVLTVCQVGGRAFPVH